MERYSPLPSVGKKPLIDVSIDIPEKHKISATKKRVDNLKPGYNVLIKATQKGDRPISSVALATFVVWIAVCQQAKSADKKIPALKAISFVLVSPVEVFFNEMIYRMGRANSIR